MAKWDGCGHEVKLRFFRNDILSIIEVVEYTENNPNKLCYDCWKKERGR